MNPSNPLESVFYISIPENFVASDEDFKIDPKILLPVQKKPDEAETVPNEGLAMKNVEFTSEIVDTITEDTKKEEEE